MKTPGALSNRVTLGLALLITAGALLLWLLDPIPMRSLRLAQFDQFQRWYPRSYGAVSVPVVDIDEASLKAYGQWPWPRSRMAELVQRLHEAGASAIALDFLLAEPDRTAPKAMAQLWNNPQASALLQVLPDPDAVLAQAIVGSRVVLGSSLSQSGAQARPSLQLPSYQTPPWRLVNSSSSNPAIWLQGFDEVVWPLAGLSAYADGLGAMNFAADSDGVVRRVPMLLRLGDTVVPSLSAEALRVAQNSKNIVLRSNDVGVQDLRLGNVTVPTNAQAEIWLHYTEHENSRFISAQQILSGTVDTRAMRGQIVLVGSSAAGLVDLRFNPMGQLMPGVLAHALALEQMLSGQHLLRPAWTSGAEALMLVLGCLLVGMVAMRATARWSALVTGLVLAGLGGAAWYAFVHQHLLLDAANPGLAVGFSFVLASVIRHFVSEREQRWIHQAFSRYVSPNRVAYLMAHPEQLQINGRRQVCSFVFTDLAGFTAMLEASDPAEVVARLNTYLDGMIGIVFKHEGTLDRIMGDALVVLFSAPVAQADHRQRALDCALEMNVFATNYAQTLQATGLTWGHTRIGVHCGEVIVGNFGGKTLFDYRALGDPINTAARLESVNRHLGTRVCVSQAIMEGCPNVPVRPVGRLLLKGKSQPLQTFEPLAAAVSVAYATRAEYEAAMMMLQGGQVFTARSVLSVFENLARRFPLDPLVALHLRRLQGGAHDDLIVMTQK
jgi:adenylate cyclase